MYIFHANNLTILPLKLHHLTTMSQEKEQIDEEEKLALEVTVLSADSLKPPSWIFPFRLRPYVTVSTPFASTSREIRTSIDEIGTHNPTFNQTFRVPLSRSFFEIPSSKDDSQRDAVHVNISSKRPLLGPAEIGWCRICATDVMDGYKPPAVRRRLSYALRSPRDGCKGNGYVHVAARVVGPGVDQLEVARPKPQPGWCRVAIGIPVAGAAVPVWEQRSRGAWSDVAGFGRK